jgi:hypothetical protein
MKLTAAMRTIAFLASAAPAATGTTPEAAAEWRSNQRLDRPVRPRSRNHMYPAAQAQR